MLYITCHKTYCWKLNLKIYSLVLRFRDRQRKIFEFLSRFCKLSGGGGQDKSAKNCQFLDESLLFQVALTTHSDYKTVIWYESISCMLFSMALQHVEFCAYADVCTGNHAHCLEAHQLKRQSSTCWKPVLSVIKQKSSHLQPIYNDFSNAFPIKDGFR